MFRVPDLQRILDLTMPGVQRLKAEFFTDAGSQTSPVTGASVPSGGVASANGATDMGKLGGLMIGGVLLLLAFGLFVFLGAARLSWCYNSYLGTGTGMSVLYAFLAFWFNTLYYPYYAWFVDPYCNMKSPVAMASVGGRRRR